MKKIISTFLAAVMLFTATGINAATSDVIITGTNLSTGENVKGIADEDHPVVITFSGNLHSTYNSISNVYLNNVQLNDNEASLSVSGNKLTIDFADGLLRDGTEYTLELNGLFDANSNSLGKRVIKFTASGEDKISEMWKLNKGTTEKPDLLMFDGRVNGTVRGWISVQNLGFATKTYGVKLVSKRGNETVKTSGITQVNVASGELKEIYAELDVTDREDVYLHVVDGNGNDVKEPIMITTESVPEAAMLLDEYFGDSFNDPYTAEINGQTQQVTYIVQSGWVFDFEKTTGSTISYSNNNYLILRDKNTNGSVTASKKFLSHQKGIVTLDFEFSADTLLNGSELAITGYNGNDKVDIVKMGIDGGNTYVYSGKIKTNLAAFTAKAWNGVRAEVNMNDKTFDLYFNGSKVLEDANFYEQADTLSAFRMKTPDSMTGELWLRYLYAHRGYYVYDKFVNSVTALAPETWDTEGVVATYSVNESRQNDTDVLLLGRSTTAEPGRISKEYGTVNKNTETRFMFKTTGSNHLGIALMGENDYYVFGFDIYGTTPYFDGTKIEEKISGNIWHEAKFIFDVDTNTIDFYLNDRKLASKKFVFANSVIGIAIEGNGGQIVDDVTIQAIDRTTTVIDESQIPEKGNIDVHMIVYPMWREGSHFGWDRITEYPERTPYLGYYDSGNVEATNMQIKWLVEHGVNAMIIPYSRAVGSNGQKPKISNRFETLHEGYFRSPYRDMIDFGILYSGISTNSLKGSNDFKYNLVPFWIEHYFKHDNYAKTSSGQAVFYMYTLGSFYDIMSEEVAKEVLGKTRNELKAEYKTGGMNDADAQAAMEKDFKQVIKDNATAIEARMKECFDYLEAEVMKITDADGNPKYTGLYTVFVDEPTDSSSYTLADACGGDAVFQYGDAQNAAYEVAQRKRYNSAKTAQVVSGAEADYVPSGYMGYQRHPWDGGTSGGFCDPDGLERVLTEIKADVLNGVVSPEKLVTLGCWDEFGEGHFFMPSEVQGFAYLDAVRNVFGDGSEHTDVKPTSLEQRRFGWFYQNDGTGYRSFPWNDASDDQNDIVKGWYFGEYTNADITGSASKGFVIGDSGWTVYNAKECTIENGVLKIVDSDSASPVYMDFGYNDSSTNQKFTDISANNCTKLSVTIDSNWENARGDYGLLYFATRYTRETLGYTFMQSDSTGACIAEPFRWAVFRDGHQETDLINNKWWQNDIQKLRYWPAYYTTGTNPGSEPLTIHLTSIELLGDIAQ